MDRQKYKDVLLRMKFEDILYMEDTYGTERFSFEGVLNEYLRQQVEKGAAENAKYKDIKEESHYSNSGIKKIKRKYLGIKNKPEPNKTKKNGFSFGLLFAILCPDDPSTFDPCSLMDWIMQLF